MNNCSVFLNLVFSNLLVIFSLLLFYNIRLPYKLGLVIGSITILGLNRLLWSYFQKCFEENQKLIIRIQCLTQEFKKKQHHYESTLSERSVETRKTQQRLKNSFQLLSHLSHELKTPLNNVLGFTQYLLQVSTMPQHIELLEIIERSGKSLGLLTRDLLDAAHRAEGNLKLNLQPFKLRQTIEELSELLPAQAHAKGLRFALYVSETLPEIVLGDPLRLQQILVNLINNAIKFTSSGSVICRVYSKNSGKNLELQKKIIFFEVYDTGKGIHTSRKTKVFKAFESEHSLFSYGSGLGLYICNQLVQMMNGKISLTSSLGVGTTISFSIPLKVLQESRTSPMLNVFSEETIALVNIYSPLREAIEENFRFEPVHLITTTSEEIVDLLTSKPKTIVIWFIDPSCPEPIQALLTRFEDLKKKFETFRLIIAAPLGLNEYCVEAFLPLRPYGYISTPFSHQKICEILLSNARLQRLIHKPHELEIIGSKTQIVMIIDDHAYHLRLMEIFLKKFGFSVVTCISAENALQKLKTVIPAVIFVDVEMPIISGPALLERIRKHYSHLNRVPILALTAGSKRLNARKHHFSEILYKPIEAQKVHDILKKYFPLAEKITAPLQCKSLHAFPVKSFDRLKIPPLSAYFDPELALKQAANDPQLCLAYLKALKKEGPMLINSLNSLKWPCSKKECSKIKKFVHYFYSTALYSGAAKLKESTRELLNFFESNLTDCSKENFEHRIQDFTRVLRATLKVIQASI